MRCASASCSTAIARHAMSWQSSACAEKADPPRAASETIVAVAICEACARNQASIEEDLTVFINDWIELPDDALRHRCEQTVRNYDPCISCATHFLDLRVDRA